MQYFFIEPDTGGTVDPFDDEVNFVQPVLGRFDIFVFKPFEVKFFQVVMLLCCRLKFGIAEFVIKSIKSFTFEQMIDSLASFTAKVESLFPMGFGNHYRFIKLEVAVGTGNFWQTWYPCLENFKRFYRNKDNIPHGKCIDPDPHSCCTGTF